MACNDTKLTAAFNDIALAIRYLADKQCCDNLQIDINGGIQGTITQGSGEVVPIYGSQAPIELGPGQFPPEYPTFEAYDADKCRKANAIINGLISSLTNLAALGTFNAIALAGLIVASIATSILFPPAAIPTAISILIILSGSLVLIAQLNAAIIADRAEWVCWLYEGENAVWILEKIADALDIIIAGINVGGKLAWALKGIVLWLLNADTLNQLFSGAPVAGGGDVDCTTCGCNPTGLAEFYEIEGATWGSGDLSVDCQERVLTSNVYAAGTWHFVGVMNTGANDLLFEAISADPGITNNGNFGGMSGFGQFTMFPNSNLYFGGQDTPFTMVARISGLDTVNGEAPP